MKAKILLLMILQGISNFFVAVATGAE